MGLCCVYGCNNRSDRNRKPGIAFHRFPQNPDRRALWTKAVKRKNWTPGVHSVICTEHFSPDQVNNTYLSGPRLREDALPNVFPAYPSYLQPSAPKKRKEPRSRDVDTREPSNIVLKGATSAINPVQVQKGVQSPDEENGENFEHAQCQKKEEKLKLIIRKMRASLRRTRMIIKSLRRRNARMTKKATNMKTLFHDLKSKSLITNECAIQLTDISGVYKELFVKQCSKGKGYSPELRSFALALDFYSPKAYSYIRNMFNTCLPHPRTLAKWCPSVDASPGFCTEALSALKEKANGDFPLLCSLIVDEMAIRKCVEWDGRKTTGYVDFGSVAECDNKQVAREAYVLMVVAINMHWRVPVGYFLTDGISGEQRCSLVTQCLRILNDAKVTIVSLTCDGSVSNISMANQLRCNIKHDGLLSSFPHPVTKSLISFFLDPCHMLKLVRNTLGDKKILYDKDGQIISWNHIILLQKLQESEGLHLANKLRGSHVNYKLQKMNVKLAAQLLSASVADALQFCLETNIEGFKNVKGLIVFLKLFSRLFDILNSRSILQKYSKQAMNSSNAAEIKEFFAHCDEYISNLRDASGTLICSGSRKTGFLGFRVCMQSAIQMYDYLVISKQMLKYLPFYKVSQDHIEFFLGYLRSRFGCNNNPTAKQFISAFKKILIHKQLHIPRGSNCLALEDIPILTFTVKKDPVEGINCSTPCFDNEEFGTENDTESSHHHLEELSGSDISEFSSEVVKHIAVFVVLQIERKIACEQCISCLREVENSSVNCHLIRIKNRGGLVFPSKDLISVCRRAEKKIREVQNSANRVMGNTLDFMTSQVLKDFLHKSVFTELNEHCIEQSVEDNHVLYLVRLICQLYFNIRLRHAFRMQNEKIQGTKIRQHFTKVMQFKGQ